jgi:hypothetical protein
MSFFDVCARIKRPDLLDKNPNSEGGRIDGNRAIPAAETLNA